MWRIASKKSLTPDIFSRHWVMLIPKLHWPYQQDADLKMTKFTKLWERLVCNRYWFGFSIVWSGSKFFRREIFKQVRSCIRHLSANLTAIHDRIKSERSSILWNRTKHSLSPIKTDECPTHPKLKLNANRHAFVTFYVHIKAQPKYQEIYLDNSSAILWYFQKQVSQKLTHRVTLLLSYLGIKSLDLHVFDRASIITHVDRVKKLIPLQKDTKTLLKCNFLIIINLFFMFL